MRQECRVPQKKTTFLELKTEYYTCNYGRITEWDVSVTVKAWVECLCNSLFIDEKWHHKEHLEEAAYGTDLDGVYSLDGFHQEGDDCEKNRGQERVEQTKTRTSFWFLRT